MAEFAGVGNGMVSAMVGGMDDSAYRFGDLLAPEMERQDEAPLIHSYPYCVPVDSFDDDEEG